MSSEVINAMPFNLADVTTHQCSSFAKTHVGQVRRHNEDAVLELTEQGVWLVADGMGGHSAGEVASKMVIKEIEDCVQAQQPRQATIEQLQAALQQANQRIYQYSQQTLAGKTMGCTVVLLLITAAQAHCLWVGDSRCYQFDGKQLIRRSRDHSQVMELVAQGLLPEQAADDHPLANVITRAIGVQPEVMIDHWSTDLLEPTQFLLCSDGLTKELTDQQLAYCLQANSVIESGLAMMHSALTHGASDNVSCVIVKVKPQLATKSAGWQMTCEPTIPHFQRRFLK